MSIDKIYITCKECGRVLDVLTDVSGATGDIEVYPCSRCLEDAKSAAYEDGYTDGKGKGE